MSEFKEFWISKDRHGSTIVEYETEKSKEIICWLAKDYPIDDDSIKVIEYAAIEAKDNCIAELEAEKEKLNLKYINDMVDHPAYKISKEIEKDFENYRDEIYLELRDYEKNKLQLESKLKELEQELNIKMESFGYKHSMNRIAELEHELQMIYRIDDVKANTIAELENKLIGAGKRNTRIQIINDQSSLKIQQLESKLAVSEARNKIYRYALEYYANPANWYGPGAPFNEDKTRKMIIASLDTEGFNWLGGKTARHAIAQADAIKGEDV